MDKKFNIGDVVYVSGNVRFKDDVGEVVDLSRNADFVVVKMYADNNNRSFHSSDLSIDSDEKENDRDDDDIEIYAAFYDEEEHKGWVGKLRKSEQDGRTKWREVELKDEKTHSNWGGMSYMSYLSPKHLMSWLEKDYGRKYEVRGPFESRAEAREFMKRKFSLDESVIKVWDKVNAKAKKLYGVETVDELDLRDMKNLFDEDKANAALREIRKNMSVGGNSNFWGLNVRDMEYVVNTRPEIVKESVIAEAKKSFKPGDKVHIAYAVKGGSGVFGTLEKIEGEYARVKSKVDGREKTYTGHANLLSDGKVEESAVPEEALNEWLELYSQLGEEAFEVFENKRLSLQESEVLQRMLKHVSDKQDFRNLNSHSDLDYAAVSDAKKVSAGKKKKFGGVNYKNDTVLMRALLDRAASSKRKIERQAAKYDKVNRDETAGKMPTTKVNLDKYRDYLKSGKSIKGGRAGTGFGGSASFSDDGGVGESFAPTAPPHVPKDRAFKKFYNFLHHMAEEEFPACKVIHIEPSSDAYQTIEFHVECRDHPRKEGFQKDLTDKLQLRLDRHPIPGLGVVNCKVFHARPKREHIAK